MRVLSWLCNVAPYLALSVIAGWNLFRETDAFKVTAWTFFMSAFAALTVLMSDRWESKRV